MTQFRNELERKALSWCSSNQLGCTFLSSLPVNTNTLLGPKVKIISGQALPRKERNPMFKVGRLIQLRKEQKSWFGCRLKQLC